MWTLLLWLNHKIVARYKDYRKKQKDKKMYQATRYLPEYLKRDMGLPPYSSRNNRFDL